MTQAAAMTTGAATADAAIHLRDVSVHFGDITGLKEASFDIAPGEFVSVVGPSGCGKTTLLNRLLSEDHGQRILVMVNDFGAINIDAGLIDSHDGETVSLTNGCACCQLRDDMIEQLSQNMSRLKACVAAQ